MSLTAASVAVPASRARPLPLLTLALASGLLLRLASVLACGNVIYPDEIWQVLQPAHRLITGQGFLPWEYVIGIRSWLFPGLVALALSAGRAVSSDPAAHVFAVRLMMTLASLAPIVMAYLWGRNLAGRLEGLIAAWATALWVDLVYIAPHTLNEVLAGDVLIVATYAALPGGAARRRFGLAGALLGLALALRVHLAPAASLIALVSCQTDRSAWRRLVLAASVPLAASGLADWLTLGTPFQSIWLNIQLNVVEGLAAEFGTNPAADLFALVSNSWGPGLVPFLVLAALGGRRMPVLPLAAAAVVATHLCFAHKEYRFIFPSFPLLAVAASLGLADIVRWAEREAEGQLRVPQLVPVGAIVLWAVFSEMTASVPVRALFWSQASAATAGFADLARVPGLCGVGLVDLYWPGTPGNATLPDGVSIVPASAAELATLAPAFNGVLADVTSPIAEAGYRKIACHADNLDPGGSPTRVLCSWVRPGGCDPAAAPAVEPNWPAYFLDPAGRPDEARIARWRFKPLLSPVR